MATLNAQRREVNGTVRLADGTPARGVNVSAFDRDLRSEQLLGRTVTDARGDYIIAYEASAASAGEAGSADVIVRALASDGSVLVASPVWFNAPAAITVDLTIDAQRMPPPSLFERIESTVKPVLGKVKVEELDENEKVQDISFLAGEGGFEVRDVARYALAQRAAKRGLVREFWFALLGGSFFEYAPGGLAKNLEAVFTATRSLDEVAVRKILAAAFERRDIAERFKEQVSAWIEAFLDVSAGSTLGDEATPSFARQALTRAGISGATRQVKFARLLNQYGGFTPELIEALRKDRSFKKAEVASVEASYRLRDLTRSDSGLVQVLMDSFEIRAPEQIRVLAKQSEKQWTQLIERNLKGRKITSPIALQMPPGISGLSDAQVYARALEQQFREAFPTAAFSGGLERALKAREVRGLAHGKEIHALIEAQPTFDLLHTSIDAFLGDTRDTEVRRLAKNADLRVELKATQRVFKLAPSFEATDALLADGVHSAQMIYRMGQSEFVRRYADKPGFSAVDAKTVWNKAADTHAAVITVVSDLKALDPETLPVALNSGSTALASFPNWQNLFQSGDICNCEDCRSVLSPAAYFTDLLMFLRDRRAANPAFSVKDMLFARRPDLGYLELNCENAFTMAPQYVDIVCEVLESGVSKGASDIELAAFAAMPAGTVAIHNAVSAALTTAGIDVGAEFTVQQVDAADPDRWVVHGEASTWLLKKKTTANFFAQILPNTKASAEELRACPAYVDAKAYDTLRQSRFPSTLPFDLFAEEVRATFQKCGLDRWDLMRTLHGAAAPNNATEGEIACEYFAISCDAAASFDERRLILVADTSTAAQQAVWGETGNAGWLATIANLKTFLAKTGLEYEQLLALLDLPFLNPSGALLIRHLDASCDTAQKVIDGLDNASLDRIHRFLRLWRKTSWAMWEVDLLIRSASIGNGALDEPCLIRLYYLGRLKRRLGSKTSVEQLVALFDPLNIETHFSKAYEKRIDGLYQQIFLNRRGQPPEPALAVAAVDVPAPTAQKISGHRSALVAGLGIRERDLDVLVSLTRASDGSSYITDDLTLDNLSFLWRHAFLAKSLKLKIDAWQLVLKLLQQDVPQFADPKSAVDFLENVDRLGSSGLPPDALDWILTADRAAKAAIKEQDAIRFLAPLRANLQSIHGEYDASQYEFLTSPADTDRLTALLTSLLQSLKRDDAQAQFFVATLADQVQLESPVTSLPAGFDFPAPIKAAIRIRYDEPRTLLRFTGLMTATERNTLLTDPSLAAVTGIAAYQNAIADLFEQPRLAIKFLEPEFSAPLAELPPAVDFSTLTDTALKQRITYDTEEQLLTVNGILSVADKAALDALSADADYRNAVLSLFSQPTTGVFAPEVLWLDDTELLFPLRDLTNPGNDHLAENLATAIHKALAYLLRTQSEIAVIRQSAAQLGLTEGLTRRLFSEYSVLPETLLAHFTDTFAQSGGVIDYATLKPTFDAWFWANRVAALWNQARLTTPDWRPLNELTLAAQILDWTTLPLDSGAPAAPIDRVLRWMRLLAFRRTLPETQITFLEVLEKLNAGSYSTPLDFAADVELLNDAWSAEDVGALIAAVDLAYPNDYLLIESWERVRRAFYFAEKLNARIATVAHFAAATMSSAECRELRGLLRSALGTDSWLALSTDVQDALRERKRDALAAWHLSQPQPPDAPSGKWENTNDLYAYYLFDVEMCSCQLTSRLVHASGSVQLFVQRCFMGLEPNVKVEAEGSNGDGAWRWWQWMRKYRVWEANRKVFLWPENWIEPELKVDRSSFFKELENDLLQNDVTSDTVEAAFAGYLQKLDAVAQLEITGFYQEDTGTDSVIHVFARTRGAEPHLYYYRRFDYRQWSPWEKIDLDIKGDYLVPAAVNQRLFAIWPVFGEISHEESNSTVATPSANQSGVSLQKTATIKTMQLAVSDYRRGKWTPQRVSKDRAESGWITVVQTVPRQYRFVPIDRSDIDGRFGIRFSGYSLGRDHYPQANLDGAFELSSCSGAPQLTTIPGNYKVVCAPEWASVGQYPNDSEPSYMKWAELGGPDEFKYVIVRHDWPQNDLTFENFFASGESQRFVPVLMQTPWLFRVTPPWQLSYFDKLLVDGMQVIGASAQNEFRSNDFPVPLGMWLPFFYDDKRRTFVAFPCFALPPNPREDGKPGVDPLYYPQIKQPLRQIELSFQGLIDTWLATLDLTLFSAGQRQALDQMLHQTFPEEAPLPPNPAVPYTTAEADVAKSFIARFLMRYVHLYLGALALQLQNVRQLHFKTFYHPFVCDFVKLVADPLKGISALMSRATQLKDSGFSFRQSYQPTPHVLQTGTEKYYPREDVDFTPDGAYSPYNWELFFHAPLLIANTLARNQRFEEARAWYHYIFNPVGVESVVPGGSAMSKYWITKPFFETTDPQYVQQRIENILRMLAGDTTVPGYSSAARTALEAQVRDWRDHPFEPHRIASYRTVAYQKTVFMKYLDLLISWGDYLFRQDTMESVNEAMQLYVLAAELLGPRPRKVPPQVKPPVESYNELEDQLDAFANALVEVENFIPPQPGSEDFGSSTPPLPTLYYCIPQNENMLRYWDTVADRLYKLRHCMNIEGVVRQLALFEPPIDPGALVKAVAAGIDISAALADLNAPLPLYRFHVLLQKANELCNDLRGLGAALLAALEKKDAEALNLLRQSHEVRLLEAVKTVRERQLEEAQQNLAAVQKNRELAEIKRQYYESRQFMNAAETAAVVLSGVAVGLQAAGTIIETLAGTMASTPDYTLGGAGFGGSPVATLTIGGTHFGAGLSLAARALYGISTTLDKSAGLASTIGSHQRRQDEWLFQRDLAAKEIEQLDRSIAAAELRVAAAQGDLDNQVLQIDNAKAVDEFMHSKYTNVDLYSWQIGQITTVYFQSYKLAYDLAKRAERCARFELGLQDSSYISFGYWDNLKKGLLCGDKLQYDLRRLESAYLEQHRREFELTRSVSLLGIDPLALVQLRQTGRCFFSVPEWLLDLDYPGHYFRRLKTVNVTIPCVAGPHTTVSCTLRLLRNSIRINTADGDSGYSRNVDDDGMPTDDSRFIESSIPVKAIATSSAQNDSGLFELSFSDERYLPFEGAGAVSDWSLELFNDAASNNPDPANPDFGRPLRQFDYGTVTDVILQIKYTAREDAGPFKNGAVTALRDFLSADDTTPLLQMLDLRRDFASQWSRFLHPTNAANGNVLEIDMDPALFPGRDEGKVLKVNTLFMLAGCSDAGDYGVTLTPPLELPPPPGSNTMTLKRQQITTFGGMHFAQKDVADADLELDPTQPVTTWKIRITRPGGGNLQEGEMRDLFLVLAYQWE